MIRVFVVSPSPRVRDGLRAMLGASGTAVVVGAAADLGAADAALHGAGADVVVVDAGARADSPVALRAPPDAAPHAPALVVLADDPAAQWTDAAASSDVGRAILSRDATAEEIVAAVEAAAAGLVAIPTELARTLRPAVSRPRARLVATAATALTPREVEVLRMLAEGAGNKNVAARLGISEHTVKTHVTSIFEKLGASTRAEAVATGVRLGLILL